MQAALTLCDQIIREAALKKQTVGQREIVPRQVLHRTQGGEWKLLEKIPTNLLKILPKNAVHTSWCHEHPAYAARLKPDIQWPADVAGVSGPGWDAYTPFEEGAPGNAAADEQAPSQNKSGDDEENPPGNAVADEQEAAQEVSEHDG
jgi:hypothetical protein